MNTAGRTPNKNKDKKYKYMGNGALGCSITPHVPCADKYVDRNGDATIGKIFSPVNFAGEDAQKAFEKERTLMTCVNELDPTHYLEMSRKTVMMI